MYGNAWRGRVKTTPDDAAMFREECIRQQSIWGLTDWTIQFGTEPAPQGCKDEAMVDLDCDTRHAKMTYYIQAVEDAPEPHRRRPSRNPAPRHPPT